MKPCGRCLPVGPSVYPEPADFRSLVEECKSGNGVGRNNYQDFGCRRGKKKRTAKTVLQVFFNLSQQENFGNFQSTTTSGINNN